MKRVNNLFDILISDSNIIIAIQNVNKGHKWSKHHKLNKCTLWVEQTKAERVKELRYIVQKGFIPNPTKDRVVYDVNAKKDRLIREPRQYPDQYIHHMLIQALQPVMMRGMDYWCCGSIKGRGSIQVAKGVEKWMSKKKGSKYCAELDIRHFYDELKPEIVMKRMKCLVKDYRVLDLIERVTSKGIFIGAYPSQWFANVVLQPLDHMIRDYGVSHYVRYMDNMTIFSDNKRKLRKLTYKINEHLSTLGLELKYDWQIFKTSERMPKAVGFRYGKDYVLMKKANLLRTKRQVARYNKRKRNNQKLSPAMARSLLSRTGQLKHCSSYNIKRKLIPKGMKREWKKLANADKN